MSQQELSVQIYAFPLSPDASAELRLKGTITPEDLELLRTYIEITIKALTREVQK